MVKEGEAARNPCPAEDCYRHAETGAVWMGAHWNDLGSRNHVSLTLIGSVPDEQGYHAVLAIIRSVRFDAP